MDWIKLANRLERRREQLERDGQISTAEFMRRQVARCLDNAVDEPTVEHPWPTT